MSEIISPLLSDSLSLYLNDKISPGEWLLSYIFLNALSLMGSEFSYIPEWPPRVLYTCNIGEKGVVLRSCSTYVFDQLFNWVDPILSLTKCEWEYFMKGNHCKNVVFYHNSPGRYK